MTKSYTLAEIHQNRLRIKSIPKNVKFLEIYNLCSSFGELMFFDVLSCVRPLVYASFVNRKDAFAVLVKINGDKLMEASFSNELSGKYSNEMVFVLDLTVFEEFEKNRSTKKKQIRVRSRKDRNFKNKQFEKNFDVYPECYSTDSNSEILVNDVEIEQLLAIEHNMVIHTLSDKWESVSQQSSDVIFEENEEEEEESSSELSLTSWSVFNGEPKDWTQLRLPRKRQIIEYFPSLKQKSF